MIIGFDASRAFVKRKTGTENYSYNLLKALAKIDAQNHYLIYCRPGVQIPNNFPKNFEFCTLNFKFLWTQGGLALQTFKDNLDVLFVPAHTLPVIRRPGLKTVVTVHDLGSKYLPQTHQLKQRLYLGFMQKYQLKGASKIIAVSKATAVDLTRSGIDSKKIKVIYEGYDSDKFKVQSKKFKVKNYYLFVGTVQPRKNLERLIKAFSGVEPPRGSTPRLLIAGQKGWMSDDIYKLAQKLKNRVKFLGYVPDKKLPALYRGARALLFPSLFEGFGLPILEAQACGCPVLTSNISSMPEVAGSGAIFVNPYDIDDIVRGMEQLTVNSEQLIKAGFENVKRFSWEKCAAQTLSIL